MRYNKFLSIMIVVLLACVCACSLPYIMDAQAAQNEKGKPQDVVKENKSINGKVGFISSKFISIIDSTDEEAGIEHEILIYLDDNVDVQRKNSLNEINVGDEVQIQYENTTQTLKGVRKGKQVAKVVKFLREAKTKDSTLTSGKK